MPVTSEEREILERIRSDDPAAFPRFVDLYADRIFGFGLRMCGEREDAKDVVQEVLIQAFRGLRDLEHPEALRSWLYRVAANACLMKRRKARHEARDLSLEDLAPAEGEGPGREIPDPRDLPDAEAARSQLRTRVKAAIGDLPPLYRIVLVMRDMEGLSTAETAIALGIPETAVKMRLHRARLRVRQILAAEEEGG